MKVLYLGNNEKKNAGKEQGQPTRHATSQRHLTLDSFRLGRRGPH